MVAVAPPIPATQRVERCRSVYRLGVQDDEPELFGPFVVAGVFNKFRADGPGVLPATVKHDVDLAPAVLAGVGDIDVTGTGEANLLVIDFDILAVLDVPDEFRLIETPADCLCSTCPRCRPPGRHRYASAGFRRHRDRSPRYRSRF